MHTLVLLRHGQSEWNRSNQFTGWADVDLTDEGREQARRAGQLLRARGFDFDLAYTSYLKRAIRTLWITLDEMDRMWLPVERDWRLNERHYGALQGLNKAETAAQYGDDQVLIWRRSYSTPPPPLSTDDDRYPGHDLRYATLTRDQLPVGECLEETVERVLPYWNARIAPQIQAGKRVIITAHGNSLRALVKHLDAIDDESILKLNIPTGEPLVYELDEHLKPIRHYYLNDPDEIARAMDQVASQGQAKS